MAFICDDCNRQNKKELAPFRVESADYKSVTDCCSVHVIGELLAQLAKGNKVTVLRGEVES